MRKLLFYISLIFVTVLISCNKEPAESCEDGYQNQNEIGIDCGGVCRDCGDGNCLDGIMNGNETGIDCGGECNTVCPETCFDGILNQDEEEIDCGGICDLPCDCNPDHFNWISNFNYFYTFDEPLEENYDDNEDDIDYAIAITSPGTYIKIKIRSNNFPPEVGTYIASPYENYLQFDERAMHIEAVFNTFSNAVLESGTEIYVTKSNPLTFYICDGQFGNYFPASITFVTDVKFEIPIE